MGSPGVRVPLPDVDVELNDEACRRYPSMAMRGGVRGTRPAGTAVRSKRNWHSNECVGSCWVLDDAHSHSIDRKHQRLCEATVTQMGSMHADTPLNKLFCAVSWTAYDRVALDDAERRRIVL